ncbi:conserved hypothetical protein [Anaeromyxobacter dehalogenans 2CP-1]|uniref:Transmembrane protein n=1 Tax=Anaeromyxobacter dehalogenans (strain ATCC BAA-258 / DSM 21875 / 2CP-1) TaxID=455488 RepID=B8JGK3_ANAD2|nr:hypothetical protein [Anaeromyxobacter dehalogenans]ACL64674.1 conserved hypothetical protein [Anaeromyxobacter dehalogenans 2CP-1]
MRYLRALVAVVALAVGAQAARADDVYVRRHANPVGTVARDTIAGGVAGSAVAGGIILYNMGIDGNDDYDWGRTLAWGALIGAGVGLVWGIVDVATAPDYAMRTAAMRKPVRDGQSFTMDLRRRDQSRQETFSLVAGRF